MCVVEAAVKSLAACCEGVGLASWDVPLSEVSQNVLENLTRSQTQVIHPSNLLHSMT